MYCVSCVWTGFVLLTWSNFNVALGNPQSVQFVGVLDTTMGALDTTTGELDIATVVLLLVQTPLKS